MIGLVISIHVIACTLLIIIILIQRGRGGGLAESFSGVESMFGTKTNAFLSRTTTVLSVLFFVTCLSLAVLSMRQSRSLMKGIKPQAVTTEQATPATTEKSTEQAPESTPKPEEKAAQPQEAPKAE